MASVIHKYPIGRSRFLGASSEGFTWSDETGLRTTPAPRHICFLDRTDGGQAGCAWGRFRFRADLGDDMTVIVRAFATDDESLVSRGEICPYEAVLLNPDESVDRKLKLFERAGATQFAGSDDMLLYEQEGRYLWLCVEVAGPGEACLRDLAVYTPRDNFFGTFPEIYRVNGDFFHRYMAIFSSVYYDLQEAIDGLDALVDADTAPASALPVLGAWMGLDAGGDFMNETQFRRLLKGLFGMVRAKGTRAAVERALGPFLDDPFYIVEGRIAGGSERGADRAACERLYGGTFDLTVIVCREPDEKLRVRLDWIIRRFAPARMRAHVVFAGAGHRMDGYCYCDINARVYDPVEGRLDAGASQGDMYRLV